MTWGELGIALGVVVFYLVAWTLGHGAGWKGRAETMRCDECYRKTRAWTEASAVLREFTETNYVGASARGPSKHPLVCIEQAQRIVALMLEPIEVRRAAPIEAGQDT